MKKVLSGLLLVAVAYACGGNEGTDLTEYCLNVWCPTCSSSAQLASCLEFCETSTGPESPCRAEQLALLQCYVAEDCVPIPGGSPLCPEEVQTLELCRDAQ